MSLPVFLQIIDIRKDYRERGEVGGRQTPAREVWRLRCLDYLLGTLD